MKEKDSDKSITLTVTKVYLPPNANGDAYVYYTYALPHPVKYVRFGYTVLNGHNCKNCGTHYPYATSNQSDGSLICWSCRNT